MTMMSKLTITPLAVVLGLYAQSTTKPVVPAPPPKKATVVKPATESPEHAFARRELEHATARFQSLSGKHNAYFRVAPALEPSALCKFDKPDDPHHWWRDCHFQTASASDKAGISEDSLRQAMKLLCSDIQFYEPASACSDRVLALFKEASEELELIDILAMQKRLGLIDSCVTVYRSTIDKKVSDLSTRETERMKACRTLDLYPPEK